jgi:hypothetical protein
MKLGTTAYERSSAGQDAASMSRALALVSLLAASACASTSRLPPPGEQGPARPVSPPSAAAVAGPARVITGERFVVPIPDGYDDTTSALPEEKRARGTIAMAAREPSQGYLPTIVLQRTPVAARDQDPAACKEAGEGIAAGVKGEDRPPWILRRAAIIAGPVGKACQMEIVAPQGVAIITELDLPEETWLMTCNHGEGDATAERICRAALAAVKARR